VYGPSHLPAGQSARSLKSSGSAQVSGGSHTLQPVQTDCKVHVRSLRSRLGNLDLAMGVGGRLGQHLEDLIGLGGGIDECEP